MTRLCSAEECVEPAEPGQKTCKAHHPSDGTCAVVGCFGESHKRGRFCNAHERRAARGATLNVPVRAYGCRPSPREQLQCAAIGLADAMPEALASAILKLPRQVLEQHPDVMLQHAALHYAQAGGEAEYARAWDALRRAAREMARRRPRKR